jgi:hypothetical protein
MCKMPLTNQFTPINGPNGEKAGCYTIISAKGKFSWVRLPEGCVPSCENILNHLAKTSSQPSDHSSSGCGEGHSSDTSMVHRGQTTQLVAHGGQNPHMNGFAVAGGDAEKAAGRNRLHPSQTGYQKQAFGNDKSTDHPQAASAPNNSLSPDGLVAETLANLDPSHTAAGQGAKDAIIETGPKFFLRAPEAEIKIFVVDYCDFPLPTVWTYEDGILLKRLGKTFCFYDVAGQKPRGGFFLFSCLPPEVRHMIVRIAFFISLHTQPLLTPKSYPTSLSSRSQLHFAFI